MRRIQFYVNAKIYKEIEEYASIRGLTIDNMARHALFQYMKRYKKNKVNIDYEALKQGE